MSEGSTAPVAAKNNTGTIALIVAGILLFVVCAMLYKDVVDSKMEKERESWGARQPQPQLQPQQGQQPLPQNQQNGYGQPNGQQFQPNGQPIVQQNPNVQYTPQGQQPPYQNQNQPGNYPPNQNQQTNYQNPGTQNYQPPAAATTPPPVDVFANGTTPAPPAAPNPELERRKQELEQRRQEQMIADQQIAALRNGGSAPLPPVETGAATAPPPSFPLASDPDSAVASAGGRPGKVVPSGSPTTVDPLAYSEEFLNSIDPTSMPPEKYLALKEKVAADAAKIRAEIQKQDAAISRVQNSPAIAQVKLYDSQWNFVEIDGGKDRNLRMKQRLTIRRGTKILGVIEITELGDDYAVGELKTANSRRDDKLKPQPGDDLIPAELF